MVHLQILKHLVKMVVAGEYFPEPTGQKTNLEFEELKILTSTDAQ